MEIEYGSEHNLKKTKTDWEKVTKEPINVVYIKGAYYAYGSELACLRLFYHYRYSFGAKVTKKVDAKFSSNLNTWYFFLEVGI